MAVHSPAYLALAVSSRGRMSRPRTRRSRSASSASALRRLFISPATRSYSGPKRCWSLRRRATDSAPMTSSTTTTATIMATIAPAAMGTLLLTGFGKRTDCPPPAHPNPRFRICVRGARTAAARPGQRPPGTARWPSACGHRLGARCPGLVDHRAAHLRVVGPRAPVEVVRADDGPGVVDHADLGVHIDRYTCLILRAVHRHPVTP